jgi:Family of unknown function (DUF5343)
MAEYPPYVNAYNSIPKLFSGITTAAVPPKVSQDFLESVLALKSSSHRALIPLLKKLGFIDQANVPTQAYRDFREPTLSGTVMAQRIREAYPTLFAANEYAWKMNKTDLLAKLRSITGAGEDDKNILAVANTFTELSKLANWTGVPATLPKDSTQSLNEGGETITTGNQKTLLTGGLGLSYTINLNLPATTEIEVFNAIFKSLRENLLRP